MPSSRRDFLLGTTLAPAALGLAACSRARAPRPHALVNITRAAAYSQDLYDTMRRVLAAHQLNVRGRRVAAEAQPGGVRARKHHQHTPHAGACGARSLPRVGRIGGHRGGSRPSPRHARPGRRRRILPHHSPFRRPVYGPESGRSLARANCRIQCPACARFTCRIRCFRPICWSPCPR